MSRQAPESIRAGVFCALIGAGLVLGWIITTPSIWSAPPALVINGAR